VGQGGGHRADVGALGVIVKRHPFKVGHELQAVRQTAKSRQHLPAGVGIGPGVQGQEQGRHDVFQVVPLLKPDVRQGEYFLPAAGQPDLKGGVIQQAPVSRRRVAENR